MDLLRRLTLAVSAVMTLSAATAAAQTTSAAARGQTPAAPASTDARPATTTFFGDTGLWFVPTGEVLGNGQWAVSGYRRGTNWIQGYTNVADFAGTFGVGIRDRAEIFGSFLVDTRVDRDVRPVFTTDSTFGGVVDRNPQVNRYWTGDHVGDFYAGAKINLLSEHENDPAAFAFRGIVKLPTGDAENGVGTGKVDFAIDAIVSKEAAKRAELAAYAGVEWRGKPDGFDTPGAAFRWGGGVGFPSRGMLRVTGELDGLLPSGDSASTTGSPIVAADGSVAPLLSNIQTLTRATLGVTLQSRKGWFVGGGVSATFPTNGRSTAFSENGEEPTGDYVDWQIRVGYHPGVRAYVPPVAPPPPPPPPPPSPPAPTPAPRPSEPAPPPAPPPATRPVTPAPVRSYTFEDIYFDFDRYTLRPEATRILDEAVNAMRQDATLRLTIEGHTCNIGTAEYNLALGNRRAAAVQEYLIGRGVSANRLDTVSYGEERPKYDNSKEETRRLNRRAVLVVRLQ